MLLLNIFLISVLVMILLFFLFFMAMKKTFNNSSNLTPFECGFLPIFWEGLPFSMQFFSISVMFLVFDVEIVVLLPIFMLESSNYIMMVNFFLLLLIFLLTFIFEWGVGLLKWSV